MKEQLLKILIIDDDPVDREIFKQYLDSDRPGGYVYAEAAAGQDGIFRLESFNPDCVLLDLNLPDMDGLAMVSRLKNGDDSLPCAVVMLTATGDEKIAVDAMKLGITDYLPKGPASSSALSKTVVSAIERFRFQQQIAHQRRAIEDRNIELEAIRTELFEEKERYRTLADGIPQLVWTADSAGHIHYGNRRLWEFIGETGDRNRSVVSLIHPADMIGLQDEWNECGMRGQAFERELRLLRNGDQTWRWHLMRSEPIPAMEGAARSWFGTFTDIEEQKRAEAALRQRQKHDSIGLLAGGIAHDFNNLLVGIMGGTSFAMDSLAEDNPAQPMLQIVLRSSERAAYLTRQLLAYSGRGNASTESVSISRIVRDTCEMVRSAVSGNVHLVVEPDPDVPDLETNASLMQQLVLNLVTNATEAVGERNGVVTVRTAVESLGGKDPRSNVLGYQIPPGQYVLLEVSDTGPGMDEKTQAQMFDPFFSTKFTGRGLGLAAVQGIVRSLIGAVQVHSAPGNGSTLRVLLPLRSKGSGLPGLQGFDPSGNKRVVLVIENEETLRQIVVATLRRAGFEVIAASGGVAGLKIYTAHSERIGLILLDANLPDMPGIEALMNLRTLSAQVPVAVMTGPEREVLSGFSGLGVVDFIEKPFAPQALEKSVNKLLTPVRTGLAAGPSDTSCPRVIGAGERGDSGGLTETDD